MSCRGANHSCLAFLLTVVLFHPLAALDRDELGSPSSGVRIQPGALIPIADWDLYYPGAGGSVSVELEIPGVRRLFAVASGGFHYLPLKVKTPLFLVPLAAGLDWKHQPAPRWDLGIGVAAGGFLGVLGKSPINPVADWGGNAFLETGISATFLLTPNLGLRAALSYQGCFRVAHFLSLSLGAAYHLSARVAQPLQLDQVEIQEIFPVLYRTYLDEPFGRIVVRNTGRFPISDIKMSLQAKPYASHATRWDAGFELAPGESRRLSLKILFSERILGILEGTTLIADLEISYRYGGQQRTAHESLAFHLLDRNAIRWDDDRKASLFVSEKDPWVLHFSGRASSMVQASAYRPINTRFRMAAGIHSSLSAYRMSYMIDPLSPYVEAKREGFPVDFLRFPRQTLKHRAGDCDDLSVLYCALLEAAGIESAFITVPGHIFAAFDMDMSPEEAAKVFASTEDLIFAEGKVWIPVEATEIGGGFLEAWRKGAAQWREYAGEGSAVLYPMHASWKVYPPVSLLEGEEQLSYPEDTLVAEIYDREMSRFVRREIDPMVAKLQKAIRDSNEHPRMVNRLGVLYARYGLYDDAEKTFSGIIQAEEYPPALINLGNLYTQTGELEKALGFFERAYEIDGGKSALLLRLAETCYRLGQTDKTAGYFRLLREQDPDLAAENAYLAVRLTEREVPKERSGLERDPVWDEE
jgi:tetratricopeptide (TPR) repeat protein